MEKKLVKIGEAAAILGATPGNLRRWEETGELLPSRKTKGGTRFYSVDDLLGFANKNISVAKVGRPRKPSPQPRTSDDGGLKWLQLPRAARDQLRELAFTKNVSLRSVVLEGLNRVFEANGLRPISGFSDGGKDGGGLKYDVTPHAVYGYVRISTARQLHDSEWLGEQRRKIEEYCVESGFVLDSVIVEQKVRGSMPIWERPEGGKLFSKLVESDVVITPKFDRMFRNALDALDVLESFMKRGINLHILDLGGDIARDGLKNVIPTIAAAFANAGPDRTRKRLARIERDQTARRRFPGGKIPFGYRLNGDRELEENNSEQEAMREIVFLRESGLSMRAISAALKAEGFNISHETVRAVLKNPFGRK
jgi:putative DNA-invertase from lambdoid prophage Rac